MSTVQVKDKQFKVFIAASEIETAIKNVAAKINEDLYEKNPLFLCVLNGAFMFAGDLMKHITIDCEISFVKLASYSGTSSTGDVTTIIGLDQPVSNRTVVVVEDIVDTGLTIATLVEQLKARNAKQIKVATLLFKPEAYKEDVMVNYIALDIPNQFIVGYGLDYDGHGRNLKNLYVLDE